MSKKAKEPDEFARNGLVWRQHAAITYSAATHLFKSGPPIHLFPAGVLGHHALEQVLKSALIEAGYTIADEQREDCAWGHNLVALGLKLADRKPWFPIEDLRVKLSIFDSYFFLRYPGYLKGDGIGEEEAKILKDLLQQIEPFATPIPGRAKDSCEPEQRGEASIEG